MRIAREEVFGPVVSLLECDSFDQAIAFANGIQYGLSTALYSRNVNLAFKAMRDLEAGITYINAPTIGAEVHLPFGGVKHTGNGHREGGTGRLIFIPRGKRFTWITPTGCSGRRSIRGVTGTEQGAIIHYFVVYASASRNARSVLWHDQQPGSRAVWRNIKRRDRFLGVYLLQLQMRAPGVV